MSLFLPPSAACAELAGLLRSPLPGDDPAIADILKTALTNAGYQTVDLDFSAICDANRLAALDLLAVPHAAQLPADSVLPVEAFLRGGGDIIALNTPLWHTLLINVDGQWLSRDEYARQNAASLPENLLLDFAPGSTDTWVRSTSESNSTTTYETVPAGPSQSARALHVKLDSYRGWDTFGPPSIQAPFPPDHTLTVFAAKGGPDTPSLAVEWREKDECRWIATVPLATEWRQYVLAPQDFKFWESNPARAKDTFNPQNAALFNVGLAVTHTGPGSLSQEYWVANFGTAKLSPKLSQLLTLPPIPRLDTLSPGYKFFEVNHAANFICPFSGLQATASRHLSVHPRPTAAGFDKHRDWRFLPLLEARNSKGQWCGIPASLTIHAEGPFKGGQWASFAISDPAWYRSPEAAELLGKVAERMINGTYFVDAGANFYTYFEDQQPTVGWRVANCGKQDKTATVILEVTPLEDPGSAPILFSKQWPIELAPGCETRVAETWQPESWGEPAYAVATRLLQADRVIDEARHEIHVWHPKSEKQFITVKDGDFILDGRRWRAHGVNYMPSSGIATEDGQYFEQWLSDRSYCPEIVDRDLDHIVDLGLNSVSIFLYHQSMLSQNLLDLLRRLEIRGLKANLSLRPGTPIDFEWDKVREMIDYYRLAKNDTVFAYDLAWEPMWMFQKDRRRFDRDWEAWVIERYGSIESAERDWEFPIPRDEAGAVTNPPVEHTDDDGPWRPMVAAYRRFLDTLLYKYYGKARDLVRSVDPNHLVSFRMTEAGDPTMSWRGVMPYDFPYLAAAVDILEPEAYGRIGDWENVKPGWFEYEYARWAAPELPVMWAEAGVSTWDPATTCAPEDKLQFQADYFSHFYRMLGNSGADGIFWWWYPGGFRYGENSDYGIINPDGSDRPASRVIRDQAKAFITGPPAAQINTWIEVDRDARADGVPGIYRLAGSDFWKAIEADRVPGLRTSGTGTTSADCPLIAVGNTPCNGSNPPKFLDAFFDEVKQDADGTTQVRITNLGEATWLAEGHGAVRLAAQSSSQTQNFPLPQNVFPRKTISVNVSLPPGQVKLRMEATGRTAFGPILNLDLN